MCTHPNTKRTNLRALAQMPTNTALSTHTRAKLKQSVRSRAAPSLWGRMRFSGQPAEDCRRGQGENIPDRKQDVALKWFRISGLRTVFPMPAHSVCMSAGADVTAFKMQQSTTAAVKLFVCVCACLTMTCLGLKQQSICFHGLRRMCLQSSPLLCFIPG